MKTVAVIFGSRSAEHDVSIVTAISSIIRPLELTKEYKVEPIYIAKDGSWFWDDRLKDIKIFQTGEIEEFMRKAPKVHLLFDNGLTLVKSSQFAGRKMYKKIDIVFPATHGTYGEDGDLMGLLEMANVPYVGCGVAASAVAMDKVLTKLVTGTAKIPSPKWLSLFSKDLTPADVKKISKELKYPLFVKPAHLGSSIGISKVDNDKELMNALEVAAHYDDRIIVEEAVNDLIEVTLPIIGNAGEELTPALLEQPLTKPEDYFDFETKYMRGGKKGGSKTGGVKGTQGYSKLPADIPKSLYDSAEKLGLDVYKTLGCTGIARVDMLIDSKTNKVYFNEVNPLPGGLYVHNWSRAGISTVDLVKKLVVLAEDRWHEKQKLTTSFSTNFLKQF